MWLWLAPNFKFCFISLIFLRNGWCLCSYISSDCQCCLAPPWSPDVVSVCVLIILSSDAGAEHLQGIFCSLALWTRLLMQILVWEPADWSLIFSRLFANPKGTCCTDPQSAVVGWFLLCLSGGGSLWSFKHELAQGNCTICRDVKFDPGSCKMPSGKFCARY